MSKSFGITLGRGLGSLGALAVEGAVRGAAGLGQFGADVAEGAQAGYDEKHAALLISREAGIAKRKATLEALKLAHIAAMNPAPVAAPIAVVPAGMAKRGKVALG